MKTNTKNEIIKILRRNFNIKKLNERNNEFRSHCSSCPISNQNTGQAWGPISCEYRINFLKDQSLSDNRSYDLNDLEEKLRAYFDEDSSCSDRIEMLKRMYFTKNILMKTE